MSGELVLIGPGVACVKTLVLEFRVRLSVFLPRLYLLCLRRPRSHIFLRSYRIVICAQVALPDQW